MSDTVRGDIVRSIGEGARAALLDRDAELAALRAIAEQLAEALEEVEWPGDISAAVTGKAIVECPSCEIFYGKGHRDDCQLAAALAAWEEWNRES